MRAGDKKQITFLLFVFENIITFFDSGFHFLFFHLNFWIAVSVERLCTMGPRIGTFHFSSIATCKTKYTVLTHVLSNKIIIIRK